MSPRRRAARTREAEGHLLLRLGRHILATARNLMSAQQHRLRVRRDEELLRQMSAYQLRDIGLERLPGGHFATIARDPWLERPVQILGRGKRRRPDLGHGRQRGGTRR